ncbi:cytochrome P450 [Bacillaceae bacterium W0354]
MNRSNVPYNSRVDESIELLMEGYQFILNRKKKHQSNLFQTRLLGKKVICMSGKEAAELFYNNELFQRKGAAPKRIQKTLFGEQAIQSLDGQAHKHRKQFFMSFMTVENINLLKDITRKHWESHMKHVQTKPQIELFNEAQQMMCKAACEWTGVPIKNIEVKQRAQDFGKMVDAFGAVGPRHWQGRTARDRAEIWIREIIQQVRANEIHVPDNSILYQFAHHKDHHGRLLNPLMAAVELINILRPIVAIATYITFSALAIHQYPSVKVRLKTNDEQYMRMFINEVRRYYPFGPFLGAKVKKKFKYNDLIFNKGQLVLLDVYGTNRDDNLWQQPNIFKPERFANWNDGRFNLIPQGGGKYDENHRCAGEQVTIEVLATSIDFLVNKMDYDVPDQEFNYDLSRMPTLPSDRFIIENIELKNN